MNFAIMSQFQRIEALESLIRSLDEAVSIAWVENCPNSLAITMALAEGSRAELQTLKARYNTKVPRA